MYSSITEPVDCCRPPAGPRLTVSAPLWVVARERELRLQRELGRHEAQEAGGPGVGPWVAGLGTSNTKTDDPDPGVAGLVWTGDLV